MEAKSSSISDPVTLTARLDSLCADQNPLDLSKALSSAFTEGVLYESYLSSLVGDEARTGGLLEVFDKVSQEIRSIP